MNEPVLLSAESVAHDWKLSREEFAAYVEEQAQRYLGMTTAEFIESVRRGELPDHPATAHLLILTGAHMNGQADV